MIEELKYLLLGLIQGLAEFFPISSSGHIILFSSVLNTAKHNPLLLSVIVHFATTLSTIIVYRNRISRIFFGITKYRNPKDISFLLKIITSSIPLIIIAALFIKKIDIIFYRNDMLVAIMLMITAFILIFSGRKRGEKEEISYYHAILIGIAQAIAIIPGISRSGATISMALLCKIKRRKAAEFSFLMVLMPIIGVTLIQIIILLSKDITITPIEINGLIIAFFTAFFSGWFACKYMIILVTQNNLKYFGYYCLIVGFVWSFPFWKILLKF